MVYSSRAIYLVSCMLKSSQSQKSKLNSLWNTLFFVLPWKYIKIWHLCIELSKWPCVCLVLWKAWDVPTNSCFLQSQCFISLQISIWISIPFGFLFSPEPFYHVTVQPWSRTVICTNWVISINHMLKKWIAWRMCKIQTPWLVGSLSKKWRSKEQNSFLLWLRKVLKVNTKLVKSPNQVRLLYLYL